MSVPGSNLLNAAMTVIAPQSFTLYRFVSRTTAATGYDVPTYDAGTVIDISSVQAVPSKLLSDMGLEWKKRHIMIWVSDAIFGPERATSGDRVLYEGSNYQVQDENYWTRQDGWTAIMCVEIADGPVYA